MEMMESVVAHPDGAEVFLQAFSNGLKPDPPLWIDEWSEENMIIPADTGARLPGPYRLTTTPFARDVLRDLSPQVPVKRVVAKVASQLWKTQVGINFLCACIARAPANALALEPTQTLTRRLASRIDKTIAAVDELRTKVAAPRSRDAKNTSDTKEFRGGALYINTAGSESNLAELTARYIYGDEVDRWLRNLGQEGDPVKLAENRAMQFGRSAKFYYSSSPTEKDASKIDELFEMGDQRHCYLPCPECGHMQELVVEQLRVNEDETKAHYLCIECSCLIEEHCKPVMYAGYEWRPHAVGDGETRSYTQSSLYAPLGAVTWLEIWKERREAQAALVKGDDTLMRVFNNTRLGIVFDSRKQMTTADELRKRAEPYRLRHIPPGVLALTASVDTQDDRLELKIVGWGEGMECWIVDYEVIVGLPSEQSTWDRLDQTLARPLHHPTGKVMAIRAVLVDSGGHHTQDVYQYTRLRRYRNVLAIAGARKPGRPVIASRPSKVDVTWQGLVEKDGAELWIVGTDTAKDWLTNRFKLKDGPGSLHFSEDLPAEYFDQLTSERRVTRFVKGYKRTEWVKPNGARNEAFDLAVYNLAAAHYIGMNRWTVDDWRALKLYYSQGGLFDESTTPVQTEAEVTDQDDSNSSEEIESKPISKPKVQTSAQPAAQGRNSARRIARSSYLRR